MKRVIYLECSGEVWRLVAARAAERHGWQPVYWSAGSADMAAIRSAWPDTLTQDSVSAVRGLAPLGSSGMEPALDADLLTALAAHESVASHMMDRMDLGGTFSSEERRRHYHDLLRRWLGLFQDLRPDIIVFAIAPHVVYDYIAYALSLHLGIPTVMFERLGLPGYVYAIRHIEADAAFPCDVTAEMLPPDFRSYLDAAAGGGRSAVPANFRRKQERFRLGADGHPPIWSVAWAEFIRTLYLLKRHGLRPVSNSYAKLKGRSPAQSRPTVLHLAAARLKAMWVKWRLRQWLNGAVEPADLSQPFILLALHYQPERATVPMGGAWGDQTLIADMLAKHLPDGWWLYVKEHPWQLQPVSRPETQRNRDFYERLARLPRTRLIPPETDTGALVDHARAVATVTGSVGWQAIARGIPALVFGAAWYKRAPGVWQIQNHQDLVSALSAIQTARGIDRHDLAVFLARLAHACVPGILEPSVEAAPDLDLTAAAGGMADALARVAAPNVPD